MGTGQISDLPPAGYVPLLTAFERFCQWHQKNKSAGHKAETKIERDARFVTLYRDFLDHLRIGRLQAIVCDPTTREKISIPSEVWATAWYPERLLKADIISGKEGEAFRFYVGRTPFVSEVQLSAILGAGAEAASKSTRRQGLYPWDECKADFLKRVADEGAPTTDGGEHGWRIPADVERWIIRWMSKRTRKEPGESTVRRHAKEFIDSIWGGSKGSQGP